MKIKRIRNSKPRSQFFRRGAIHDRKIKKSYTIRVCMMCREDFKSSGVGNRICTPCRRTDLWKSGPNCYTQYLNLSDLGSKTPKNLPSSFKNKKKEQQQLHDEKYLLDEGFDGL